MGSAGRLFTYVASQNLVQWIEVSLTGPVSRRENWKAQEWLLEGRHYARSVYSTVSYNLQLLLNIFSY
jgi:hypothetical protein